MIKKHESMIQYHLARVPFYNGKDSPEMAAADSLKEKIAKLGETPPELSELPFIRPPPSPRVSHPVSPPPRARRGDRAAALGAQSLRVTSVG